jgi:hopene-associated glycosyltransferase HpnB
LVSPAARVAVVIPARDEAESISRVIRSWQAHDYDGPLRVFLVDDHSTDGTPDIARTAIAGNPRFELLHAPEKPDGWTGKLWAVQHGVEAARAFNPDFILFTDADIIHDPGTLRALVNKTDVYDMVSLMVRLHCETLPERALIPAFVFFFFLLYPPRLERGAAGGCMLVRCSTLERAGGIESIRGELIDDCALAVAIKRVGGRISLSRAEASYSLRVYQTFGEIGHMIARTAYTQLRYSPPLLALTLLALAAVPIYWLPMAIVYIPTLRYYRRSLLWVLAIPLIVWFYGAATLLSAIRYYQGRGGEWKGRTL